MERVRRITGLGYIDPVTLVAVAALQAVGGFLVVQRRQTFSADVGIGFGFDPVPLEGEVSGPNALADRVDRIGGIVADPVFQQMVQQRADKFQLLQCGRRL